MDYTVIEKIQGHLWDSLTYQTADTGWYDFIQYWSSFAFEFLAVAGVLILLYRNPPVRKRSGTLNRLIFWECMLVIFMNILKMLLVPLAYTDGRWTDYAFDIAWTVNEVMYLLLLLQWLVCVDYCLYFSLDHIKRRYSKAAIPIMVIIILDILHTVIYRLGSAGLIRDIDLLNSGQIYLHFMKLIVEAGYILTAVRLVRDHSKRSREPSFLRLEAFIIPFILGSLIRFYDGSFVGLGVILTYAAIKRRDRYIIPGTGLYNPDYVDCICKYWDKKGIKDGSALLISAAGRGSDLAVILSEFDIPDCFNIDMGEGRFVMIAGFLNNAALRMAEKTIVEDAGKADTPFRPEIVQMRRNDGESMSEFGVRIKESCRMAL